MSDSVVYAFYHCDDPESSGVIQSLHYSKENAQKALEWHKKDYIDKHGIPEKYAFWVYWCIEELKIQP